MCYHYSAGCYEKLITYIQALVLAACNLKQEILPQENNKPVDMHG